MRQILVAVCVLVSWVASYQAWAGPIMPTEQPASLRANEQPSQDNAASAPSIYVRKNSSDFILLRANGTFSFERGGKTYNGTYTVQENIITTRVNHMLRKDSFRISGNTMVGIKYGDVWEKEGVPSDVKLALADPQKTEIQILSNEIPSGPSIEVTKAWIERQFPTLGSVSIVSVKNDDRSRPLTYEYGIESAVLSDGRLVIRRTEFVGKHLRLTYTETVTLKDVDVSKIQAVEAHVATGHTDSRPSYFVSLVAAPDRRAPFTSQRKQEGFPADNIEPTHRVRVRVRDEEAANSVVDALRRAAVLCGAPNQPVETASGSGNTAALERDDSVGASGDNGSRQAAVPAGLNGARAIAAGSEHTVALKTFGPRLATATAEVVNGFVVGINITDGGSGYRDIPAVTISGEGKVAATDAFGQPVDFTSKNGSGAKAAATIANGVIANIKITNPGSGYTAAFVTIAPPRFPPREAIATAQVVNGFVVGISITDGGFGYDTSSTVTLSGGGGSGAMAVATVINGVVTGITITNPGSDYTSTPEVSVALPTTSTVR